MSLQQTRRRLARVSRGGKAGRQQNWRKQDEDPQNYGAPHGQVAGACAAQLRHFHWLSQPPDVSRSDTTWIIDGLMMNPRWKTLSTLGLAIMVISDAGDLLARGNGVPPEWCDSASAAEAWALYQVVRSAAPFVPRVLTDCLGLLQAAEKGAAAARAANVRLARTWHHIADCLNDDLSLCSNARGLSRGCLRISP